jgi:beta-lactamase class A
MDEIAHALQAVEHALRDLGTADLSTLFAPGFLAQLPAPELRARLEHMVRELGPPTGHVVCELRGPRAARVRFSFARGYSAYGTIALDEEPHPRIQWLLFDLPTRDADTWADIQAEVAALPGRTSFEVRDLTAGRRLAAVEPERAVGVGSVSKLCILSAVLDAVGSGARRWTDLVTLVDADRSLPTGIMHDWPPGAPLTLHTATVLAISISDNTAADLLLRELGPDAVERACPGSAPFCSTRGLFALLAAPDAERTAWLRAPEAERRTLLAELAARPRPDVAQLAGLWPEGLDWYLSAAQVCAVLDRVRGQMAESPVARGVFGVNTGGLTLTDWRFAGFKGGSSPGRVAFAVLLEDDARRWVGICLAQNATPETLRIETTARLVKRAADQARAEG